MAINKPYVSCFKDISTTRIMKPEMRAAKAHYRKMINDLRDQLSAKDAKVIPEAKKE